MTHAKEVIRNGNTVGWSPKVKLPAGALFIIGAVLLVIGYLIGDNTVTAIGWSLVGSTGVVGGIGRAAPTGTIERR